MPTPIPTANPIKQHPSINLNTVNKVIVILYPLYLKRTVEFLKNSPEQTVP